MRTEEPAALCHLLFLQGSAQPATCKVDTKRDPLACPAVSQVKRELFTWHEEVKQGPQLQNIILDGRSTQQEAVLSTDALACLQSGMQLQTGS